MTAVLYDWPEAARFGRTVPKAKFYEHARISARVREQLVADVQRVTWAYKLADETIRLCGNKAVPEIQVFSIDLKGRDIGNDVLPVIDKSIPFPIIFELQRSTEANDEIRMVAAHKQLRGDARRLSPYFTTAWLPADAPRVPLPPALDLPRLHGLLLAPLLPTPPRPGEDLEAAIARLQQTRKIEREVTALEKRLRAEPQLNRKIELRRQLRDRTTTLSALTSARTSTTEDSQWKS